MKPWYQVSQPLYMKSWDRYNNATINFIGINWLHPQSLWKNTVRYATWREGGHILDMGNLDEKINKPVTIHRIKEIKIYNMYRHTTGPEQ